MGGGSKCMSLRLYTICNASDMWGRRFVPTRKQEYFHDLVCEILCFSGYRFMCPKVGKYADKIVTSPGKSSWKPQNIMAKTISCLLSSSVYSSWPGIFIHYIYNPAFFFCYGASGGISRILWKSPTQALSRPA